MTVEQAMYGADWIRCARCGVHDHKSTREKHAESGLQICSARWRCDKFRAEAGPLCPSPALLADLKLPGPTPKAGR